MSTTMPSESSVERRNSTSTTYVAPCSCCAGPKTAPRKLCAIMMCSRTVMLYIRSSTAALKGPPYIRSSTAALKGPPYDDDRAAASTGRRACGVRLEPDPSHTPVASGLSRTLRIRRSTRSWRPALAGPFRAAMLIPDPMTQRVAGRVRDPRHDLGERVEFALTRDQLIEHRIREQRQRKLHPPPRVPPRALRRRDCADLRRSDRQTPRMEHFAERDRDLLSTVPAHLDYGRFEPGEAKRVAQSRRRAARVDHDVRVVRRGIRRRERDTECLRDRHAFRVDVDDLDLAPADAGGQPRDQTPDRAGADDSNAIADVRASIPQPVDGGFEVRREHGALGRHIVRDHVNGADRDGIARLMWIQDEDVPILQRARSMFDHADARVAVLDRPGKVAALKRRAHAIALARGHAAAKHERLGAAADPAVQRAHDDVVRLRIGERLGTNLSPPGRRNPERASLRSHRFILVFFARTIQSRRVTPNHVTAIRAVLVAFIASLVMLPPQTTIAWIAVVAATIAAVLDGVDGWLARRAGLITTFGA